MLDLPLWPLMGRYDQSRNRLTSNIQVGQLMYKSVRGCLFPIVFTCNQYMWGGGRGWGAEVLEMKSVSTAQSLSRFFFGNHLMYEAFNSTLTPIHSTAPPPPPTPKMATRTNKKHRCVCVCVCGGGCTERELIGLDVLLYISNIAPYKAEEKKRRWKKGVNNEPKWAINKMQTTMWMQQNKTHQQTKQITCCGFCNNLSWVPTLFFSWVSNSSTQKSCRSITHSMVRERERERKRERERERERGREGEDTHTHTQKQKKKSSFTLAKKHLHRDPSNHSQCKLAPPLPPPPSPPHTLHSNFFPCFSSTPVLIIPA